MNKTSKDLFKKSMDKAFSQPGMTINKSTMLDNMTYKQSFKEQDELEGGIGDEMTLKKISKIHRVNLSDLVDEFSKGVNVEKEHTDELKTAMEIAMDHLSEDPNYYSKLKKIETNEEEIEVKAVTKKQMNKIIDKEEKKSEKEFMNRISAKKQFAQDLQSDKDFQEFKKHAKYDYRGGKDSFGIPNVTVSDPYIKKSRKWDRPGKEKDETNENIEKELKGNDKDMVNGIIEILNQIKDKNNRMKVAKNMIRKFKKEGVKFNYDDFLKKCQLSKKSETKEATGSGSSGAFVGPIAFKDSEFLRKSFSETPKKLKEGIATGAMGLDKVEAKEATTSGSVGGYESPSMWAKSTKKKDWGPSRKTQLPGGSFVKVKKKCTKFPYCNQGDINALVLSKNESVKEAIENVSKKYKIGKNVIINILENEFKKHIKRKN